MVALELLLRGTVQGQGGDQSSQTHWGNPACGFAPAPASTLSPTLSTPGSAPTAPLRGRAPLSVRLRVQEEKEQGLGLRPTYEPAPPLRSDALWATVPACKKGAGPGAEVRFRDLTTACVCKTFQKSRDKTLPLLGMGLQGNYLHYLNVPICTVGIMIFPSWHC